MTRDRTETVTLSAFVYNTIKEDLLDGRYQPGQRIVIDELTQQLDVSKQPVMEALRLLSAERLVAIVPQVGCRVMQYDIREITDFLTAFASMEAVVAALAAERRTTEQLQRAEEILSQMPAARALTERAEAARQSRQINREFHSLIHEMADAPLVASVSGAMWDLRDFIVRSTHRHRIDQMVVQFDEDHLALHAAIELRNGALAAAEIQHHILGFLAYVDRPGSD
jgi:DNA-binding GntR family transcriptional regulator